MKRTLENGSKRTMASTLKRTWAEIDLDALEHNYKTLKAHVGESVKFMGIVKADA